MSQGDDAAPTRRKFGLSDAMIFVAAVAVFISYAGSSYVNLAGQIAGLVRILYRLLEPLMPETRTMMWMYVVTYYQGILSYLVLAVERTILVGMIAFLLMRLSRPRPTFRVLLRQPGMVAALAVIFGLVWVTGWAHRLFFGRVHNDMIIPLAVGSSVALAWLVLVLTRTWQPEPNWLDRTGRTLGVMAIATGVFSFIYLGV